MGHSFVLYIFFGAIDDCHHRDRKGSAAFLQKCIVGCYASAGYFDDSHDSMGHLLAAGRIFEALAKRRREASAVVDNDAWTLQRVIVEGVVELGNL